MTTHLERLRAHRARQEMLRVWRFLRDQYSALNDIQPPDMVMVSSKDKILALADLNERVIEINLYLFKDNFDLYMDEIIAHECAHIAAWDLFNCETHGQPWRRIMKRLGLEAKVRYQVV